MKRERSPASLFRFSGSLASQLCQKIGWVDWFGEDFEFVALRAGLFKQIRRRSLA